MILPRLTPCRKFEIWRPRYHDKTVLLAMRNVGTHNEIVFTKDKNWPGSYYLSGDTIKSSPVVTNGTIMCYAVPLDKLEVLERS